MRALRATTCATAWLLAIAGGADEAPQRSAFFGDLHIHTQLSFDAFMGGNRTSPDDAYEFAKGAPLKLPSGETVRISGAPLDFLAVTDHAEYLGIHASLLDPESPNYGHPVGETIMPEGVEDYYAVRGRFIELVNQGHEITQNTAIARAWQLTAEAAERHNDPGAFTTFIGYEYTLSPGMRHVHRNVIFRGTDVPDAPLSSRDAPDPEALWDWLDRLRQSGIEGMAIPHNMNQSDGLAFPDVDSWHGRPIDAAFAAKRMRNEPLVEVSQNKGTSETHPTLSPEDEWADFQIVQYYLNRRENTHPISVFKGGYWRDALKSGLVMAERGGFNAYQVGVVGASDSHVTGGSFEEDNHFTSRGNTPQSRGSAYADDAAGWSGFWTPRQATHGTGGLAGVWAERNTRAALYDAMRRRETFATSGPRIRVRFFGGFGLQAAADDPHGLVAAGYASGVPMGGVLPAGQEAPTFALIALRDPAGGWLQRAQIVKGWMEDGAARERVFDVACSDGLTPDAETHRCPDNGAEVNLADCSMSHAKGATQLSAVWTDPEFHAGGHAFYYPRVLENPSCRWSTWDAVRLGIPPNPDLPATHQERAWGSPIWVVP